MATSFVPDPTATHIDPFQATLFPDVVKIVFPSPIHVIPSYEYAIVLLVPFPTATIMFFLFHAIPFPCPPLKTKLLVPNPIQFDGERGFSAYAIKFVDADVPNAIHRLPFHASADTPPEAPNMVVPSPVHVIPPLTDKAKLFVVVPPARIVFGGNVYSLNLFELNATPRPVVAVKDVVQLLPSEE
jgi:hypothetical protein